MSNESGAYNFAALQTGNYKVSAELPGFQIQSYNNVTLGVSQQVRLNFTLQAASQTQAVEVTVAADTLLATSSATGPLQSISVFGRDPLRPTFDNTPYMRETLARMPAANDFTTCGTLPANTTSGSCNRI